MDGNMTNRDGRTQNGGARLTKACVGCRRQKMRCEPERDGPCRRCRKNGTRCVFTARANARQSPTRPLPERASTVNSEERSSDVLARLAVIETILGIGDGNHVTPTFNALSSEPAHDPSVQDEDEGQGDPSLAGLWTATENLKRHAEDSQIRAWSRPVVSQLWFAFYANMEGLHFQSEREAANDPTPVLLAAILYVSALHHTSEELAAFAPEYFRATCSAIAELSIPKILKFKPSEATGTIVNSTPEQVAFQNVLGLVLAGLISEAFIESTGVWVSIAYRLIIDHCPVYIDQSVKKWRQLFSGLQIIDLEHASLHLSCTVVPPHAPLPSLRQLQSLTEDPFSRLTVMMYTGLSHFTGRGLPTIWSLVSSTQPQESIRSVFSFTERDSQAIKEWANGLDDWLVSSHRPTNTASDAIQIRRQYHLHRLLVLSIYHPARGFDLFANSVASTERHELLLAARSTLRLQNDDEGIWANWDIVMITWAAILVLQGAEGGVGEHGDLLLVQSHLDKLRKTKHPAPSLHHLLASRLETWLQSLNVAPTTILTQPEFDPSWSLFDPNSMQIASEPLFQPGPSGTMSTVEDMSPSATRHSPLDNAQHTVHQTQEYWNAYSHAMGTWPLGFSRAFGNGAFPYIEDESVQR